MWQLVAVVQDLDDELSSFPTETFSSGTRMVKVGAPTDVSNADVREAEWADAVQAASQPQTAPAGELLLVHYIITT